MYTAQHARAARLLLATVAACLSPAATAWTWQPAAAEGVTTVGLENPGSLGPITVAQTRMKKGMTMVTINYQVTGSTVEKLGIWSTGHFPSDWPESLGPRPTLQERWGAVAARGPYQLAWNGKYFPGTMVGFKGTLCVYWQESSTSPFPWVMCHKFVRDDWSNGGGGVTPVPPTCTVSANNIVFEPRGAADLSGALGTSTARLACSEVTTVRVTATGADGRSTINLGNNRLLAGKITMERGVEGDIGELVVVGGVGNTTSSTVRVTLIDGSGGRTPAGIYRGQIVVTVTIE